MFYPLLLHDIVVTTTPLGSGATFTGATVSCANYKDLAATAYATTIGGTLYIDQSSDGTNWDTSNSQAISAGIGGRLIAATAHPWCRLRYVNGAGVQGVFRCYLKGTTV